MSAGERVLLAGPSGSGKSTLLRALAGLLETADVGDLSGSVRVGGAPPQHRPGQVGLLLQDPTAAVVADRVGRDVAFGLENTGVPRASMSERVDRALAAARFPYGPERRTRTLSGGESQRLALAGALALDPRVLLLDEPTSMLDGVNADAVRRSVLDVARERGTTLVVVEHRLEPWVDHVDRVVVLDRDGRVAADGPPHAVLRAESAGLAEAGVWVPGLEDPAPLALDPVLVSPAVSPVEGPWVRARRVTVRHRSPFTRALGVGGSSTALEGVDAELRPGASLLLGGPSGAGKSTLLEVLAGLRRPDEGSARVHPEAADDGVGDLWRLPSSRLAPLLSWVPQHSEHGMVRPTVLEELLLTSRGTGAPARAAEERARALLEVLDLGGLEHVSSHHLSGGEQRRLVLAAALVHGPRGLLLDEPTVGQDRRTWAAVVGVAAAARSAGIAVGVATHDERAVAALAAGPHVRLGLEHGVGRSAA